MSKSSSDQELGDLITMGLRRGAARIDRFLSDERSTAEENRSWIAVWSDALAEQRETVDVAVRVDARVVLPQSQEKLHVVLGGEPDAVDERNVLNESSTAAGSQSGEPRNPGLALQYVAKRTRSNDIRPEVGVHFHELDADPFIGVRWRHTTSLGTWLARATERIRAYADAGPEARTTVDFDHGLSEWLLLRCSTRATWRDEEPRHDYGQRFALFQTLDRRTLFAYECDAAVASDADRDLLEVTARWRFVRRVASDRLLVEIAPQVAWREADDFAPAAGIFVRVEIDFGRGD